MIAPGVPSSLRSAILSARGAARARSFANLLLFMVALPMVAQTNFYTLLNNGPALNRVNIVILSEGYTGSQFGMFLTHATNTANNLLSSQPFAKYRTYFNIYAIAVASTQSGSDHPTWPQFSDTYFNASYDASDQIITIPNNSTGQGKVDGLLSTFMPVANLAVLLVNDSTPGGSDGGGKTAISAIAAASLADIPVHESGHVLAKLGDEYTNPNPGFPGIEEPNTTRETNRALIKWNAWVTTNTPVPTPPTFPYAEVVGLFEGAHYHTTDWFRPKLNCRMRSFGVPFCEVCSEALVLSFYREARPVDAFTPVSTNFSISSTSMLNFAVTTLQPSSHALSVQWLTNGTEFPEATNSNFMILPASLGNGIHTVSAHVVDSSPLVRTDPVNSLSQTLTWTVTVIQPQLQLTAPRWLGPGGFTFRVAGVAPQGFAILASTNLVHWQSVATNTLVSGQYDYTNTSGTNLPRQFFRAATPP